MLLNVLVGKKGRVCWWLGVRGNGLQGKVPEPPRVLSGLERKQEVLDPQVPPYRGTDTGGAQPSGSWAPGPYWQRQNGPGQGNTGKGASIPGWLKQERDWSSIPRKACVS